MSTGPINEQTPYLNGEPRDNNIELTKIITDFSEWGLEKVWFSMEGENSGESLWNYKCSVISLIVSSVIKNNRRDS